MNKEKKDKQSILQKELNTKEMLVVLGIFGAIFIYGFLFVSPRYTDYKISVNNLKDIETKVADYESKINEMPIKEKRLDSLNREIKVKSRMLSHNMEDGMFLIGLSNLMDDVSVDLIDYSVEELIPYETFYAIPTTISVRGDYRHIREIMYYMEEQKNITQILDYNMETYISEETKEDTTNNNTTSVVPDSTVYWTTSGAAYHKDNCKILEAEKSANEGNMSSGAPSLSGKTAACQVCKPYTVNQVNNNSQETEKPKSNGIIEATFRFMMYSSDNPILELDNDNPNEWKPGKYNPFEDTVN